MVKLKIWCQYLFDILQPEEKACYTFWFKNSLNPSCLQVLLEKLDFCESSMSSVIAYNYLREEILLTKYQENKIDLET